MDNHLSIDDRDEERLQARCVALAQNRRGHGQSTLAWYLARALVAAGLRVLVVSITGRHERLHALARSARYKNLGIWAPTSAAPRPAQLAAIIQAARQQTRGRVDVILLDSDAALLESSGGFGASIDYILALVEPTETGQKSAEQLAERLGDAPPPYGRIGVVLSRVSASEVEHLPQQTQERRLPIIGYFPADYLLAGDDSQRRGSQPVTPHAGYLQAVQRLSHALTGLAGLRRITPASRMGDGQHPRSESQDV